MDSRSWVTFDLRVSSWTERVILSADCKVIQRDTACFASAVRFSSDRVSGNGHHLFHIQPMLGEILLFQFFSPRSYYWSGVGPPPPNHHRMPLNLASWCSALLPLKSATFSWIWIGGVLAQITFPTKFPGVCQNLLCMCSVLAWELIILTSYFLFLYCLSIGMC